MKDLRNVGLPKWPQMRVTGYPVTLDQANEIIRRTDSFFTSMYGGNDRAWNEEVRRRLKMPIENEFSTDEWLSKWRAQEAWQTKWGVIQTEYVHNSWISCSFIGGPHGWCHPDGSIGFVDNVGKWPSVEEIEADWQKLAEAFPFLSIGVTLMSGEECEEEIRSVVSMKIREGKATLADPEIENVHALHPEASRRAGRIPNMAEMVQNLISLGHRARECGIPEAFLASWEKKAAELGL